MKVKNFDFSVLGEIKECSVQTILKISGDSCPSVSFGNKNTMLLGVEFVRCTI